jgi:hypothetical protein
MAKLRLADLRYLRFIQVVSTRYKEDINSRSKTPRMATRDLVGPKESMKTIRGRTIIGQAD